MRAGSIGSDFFCFFHRNVSKNSLMVFPFGRKTAIIVQYDFEKKNMEEIMKRITCSILSFILCFACLFSAALADSCLVAGYDGSNTGRDWNTNHFFQDLAKRFGVSFLFDQYAAPDDWASAKANLKADTVTWDVLFKASLSSDEQFSLYQSGVLIDLKPLLQEHAPNLSALLAKDPQREKSLTLPDGAIVALPTINPLQNNNAMWINTRWLEKLGLSMPATAEELTEVLRAFRDRDPNGNGKKDELPLAVTGLWELSFLGHAFGLNSDDYRLYQDADGRVQTTLNTDENRQFLAWLHQLWEEELISHDCFSLTSTALQITDSKAAMTYGVFMGPTPFTLITDTEAAGQYALLPPMTWQGSRIYRDFIGDLIPGCFAITSHCKDPAAVLAWVDWLYTEEGSAAAQSGREGEDYIRHNDGTWSWNRANEEVNETVIPYSTMASGTWMPGYMSADFQLAFDHTETHRLLTQIWELKQVSVLPMPRLTLPSQELAKADALQAALGPYAQQAMTNFITGEWPLDDNTWQEYCRTLDELGLDQLIALWQSWIDIE